MLNKVQLIGRVGQDPEQKVLQSGSMLVNLSLATNERWKDKSGNQQEKTSWHRITLWAGQATFASQYVRKGDLLYIEGRIDYQEWEKDGVKQYGTSIVAQTIQKLTWDRDNNQPGESRPTQSSGNWNSLQANILNQPKPDQTTDTQKPRNEEGGSPFSIQPAGTFPPVNDLLEDDIPF